MKEKIKKYFDYLSKITKETKIIFVIIIISSLATSLATACFMQKRIPKFAVVDLSYLTNDAAISLSRYLIDHKASDEEVQAMIKSYIAALETIIKNIHDSGNYILLQKQMVISENVVDLTPEIEKALFETITTKKSNTNKQ